MLDHEQLAIAWALQNQEGFWALADRMGETTFQKEPWRSLWPPLIKAYTKNESFPSYEEVPQLLQPLALESGTKLAYVGLLRSLYTLDVSAWTGSEVTEWIGHQELERLGR